MSILKKVSVRLILLFIGVVISLIVLELGLRVYGFTFPNFWVPHPKVGLTLNPGAEGTWFKEGDAYIHVNSAGFRDEEFRQHKPEDVYRIVFLGDSYTEALQVDREETFWTILERRLNQCITEREIQVYNFGVSSTGTSQQYFIYKHIASKYNPDHVMLAFQQGNDLKDNTRLKGPSRPVPYFELVDSEVQADTSFSTSRRVVQKTSSSHQMYVVLRKNIRLIQFLSWFKRYQYPKLKTWLYGLLSGASQPSVANASVQAGKEKKQKTPKHDSEANVTGSPYRAPPNQIWKDIWTITEQVLLKLSNEVKKSGAEFTLITLTTQSQVGPTEEDINKSLESSTVRNLFYTDHRLRSFSQQHGIDSVILGPRMREYALENSVYLHGFEDSGLGSGHWNETAHKLAGEILGEKFCESLGPKLNS